MSGCEALDADAARRLRLRALAAVSDTPRLDAELLMAHALGVAREELLLRRLDDWPRPPAFAALLARRLAHEPVAYILGTRDFWTLDLRVTPRRADPARRQRDADRGGARAFRAAGTAAHPRSRHRLGRAAARGAGRSGRRRPGVGIDRSRRGAGGGAATMRQRLGMADARRYPAGRLGAGSASASTSSCAIRPISPRRDAAAATCATTSPHGALFAGADGLDDYRVLARQMVAQCSRRAASRCVRDRP